jgi:thiamine-monophosphate kinase
MKLASSGCASAMIDVSDGLSSDLGHLCDASVVGAKITLEMIPLSRALQSRKGLSREATEYALSSGEDYELLFTVPPSREKKLQTLMISARKIGVITKERPLLLIDAQGTGMSLRSTGYDHFSAAGSRKRTTK